MDELQAERISLLEQIVEIVANNDPGCSGHGGEEDDVFWCGLCRGDWGHEKDCARRLAQHYQTFKKRFGSIL